VGRDGHDERHCGEPGEIGIYEYRSWFSPLRETAHKLGVSGNATRKQVLVTRHRQCIAFRSRSRRLTFRSCADAQTHVIAIIRATIWGAMVRAAVARIICHGEPRYSPKSR